MMLKVSVLKVHASLQFSLFISLIDLANYPPNCHCRALVFNKNISSERMELTLAVSLDHQVATG